MSALPLPTGLTFLSSFLLLDKAVDSPPGATGLRMPGRRDGRWKMLFGVVVGASVGAAVVEDGRVKPLLGRLMNGVGCVAPVSSFSTLAIVVDPNGFFVGRMRRLRTTLLPTLAAADRGSLLLNGRRTFDSAATHQWQFCFCF